VLPVPLFAGHFAEEIEDRHPRRRSCPLERRAGSRALRGQGLRTAQARPRSPPDHGVDMA
jgi:hypothetical protein